MADVARRFELVGKAQKSARWDLASYELGEIDELFEEAIPLADPPKEGHPEVLPALAKSFREATIPDLAKALESHDAARSKAAFARVAATCNGCHAASGHAFIEVTSEPGRAVPNTDPATP